MTYHVTRHNNSRISIEMDGRLAYELEREDEGRGFWALFPVYEGKRGARIDTDQYSNDLVERVTSNLIRAGHLARVEGGYVLPVPVDVGDFYVSGTGYLCCRTPRRMVLSESPVDKLGIRARSQIRPATLDERRAAVLDVLDSTQSGVFLSVEA